MVRRSSGNTALTRVNVAVLLADATYTQPEPTIKHRRDKKGYMGDGQVNALKRRSILMGVGIWDGKDKNITRGELAVLLDRILVLPHTIDFNHFYYKDVSRSGFTYHSIEKLCYFNITQDENKNNFKPARHSVCCGYGIYFRSY